MVERRTDNPHVTLSYARHTLVAARDEGQWATMDVTLRRTVPALIALRQPQTAATVLGGLAALASTLHDDDLTQLRAAEQTLQSELGADMDRCQRSGQTMSKTELVALVLAATDAVLATDTRAARTP